MSYIGPGLGGDKQKLVDVLTLLADCFEHATFVYRPQNEPGARPGGGYQLMAFEAPVKAD
jgi:hypothetical protein|tara:strand:+ start:488 stop:667 length:180 start_codon:yes stop_codon:yes gene_type:complete